MIFKALVIISTTLLFTSRFTQAQEEQECKTVTTVENFVLEDFVSAPWYAHEQAENWYSPPQRNYCTTAQYEIKEESTFWGYTVSVNNRGEYQSGISVEANLCAYQTDESPSKLGVSPCFLPKVASGPYWVVAYNETEGYALISVGQPTRLSDNGLCKTGTGTADSGLWIFSRSQERDEALVDKVRAIATDAGFDTSVLNTVDHENCDKCEDDEGKFDAGFGRQRDCDWVADGGWFRCLFFQGNCPETCEKC